jgi:quinol monooxygenase YgiN
VYIVQVYVKVKENDVNLFIIASHENAVKSLQEDGIVRFDVLQDIEDSRKFLLTEVYKDEKAPLKHKKTPHCKKWKETVAEMMAEPRHSVKYRNIYPDNNMDW